VQNTDSRLPIFHKLLSTIRHSNARANTNNNLCSFLLNRSSFLELLWVRLSPTKEEVWTFEAGFYRPRALPVTQPTLSEPRTELKALNPSREKHSTQGQILLYHNNNNNYYYYCNYHHHYHYCY